MKRLFPSSRSVESRACLRPLFHECVVGMWESVLRISTFPHAPSSSASHLAGSCARRAPSAFYSRFMSEVTSLRSMRFEGAWRGLSNGSQVRPWHGSRSRPGCRLRLSLLSYDYAATATRPGGANGVWSRHIAYRMRVRRRANATIAIRRPRRAPTVCAQVRNAWPAVLRPRQMTQLACTSNARRSPGPVFVMWPLC